MLGGSFWVAILRNGLSVGMMMTIFLLLDRPRLSMRHSVYCYVAYYLILLGGFTSWYALAYDTFIRFAPLVSFPVIGIFCILMSRENIYLSFYKMALAFYLFSVCTLCGVDVARWWFDGNHWVDIIVRYAVFALILFVTVRKVRKPFLDGVGFLLEEMDSVVFISVFFSIFFGAIIAYWPNLQSFTIFNMVRAVFILSMIGVIQYIVFHMYIHLGREHAYQKEKELLEMNEQLLRSQLELMRESEEEAARIRHDVRHHCLLIEEFIRNDEKEKLAEYVRQYGEEMGRWKLERFCSNDTINSILSVYVRRAREENIQILVDVKVGEELSVRSIDLVAILANIFENAIHGCLHSGASRQEINIWLRKKKRKFLIRCRNTCAPAVEFQDGRPVSKTGGGVGTLSIVKAVSYYCGEADFTVENGMFVARILMNLEDENTEAGRFFEK